MITSLTGVLVEAGPLLAVLDVQGVGYEVHIPVTTAEKLPHYGEKVRLFTVFVVREDGHFLYGFYSREERDFFKLLVEHVSGIGPKIALGIMSRLSIPTLKSAIAASDLGLLCKVPGIGRKTAERLVVELKDKVGLPASQPIGSLPGGTGSGEDPGPQASSAFHDAVSALIALGYKAPDADKAVRRVASQSKPGLTTEELVRQALKGV